MILFSRNSCFGAVLGMLCPYAWLHHSGDIISLPTYDLGLSDITVFVVDSGFVVLIEASELVNVGSSVIVGMTAIFSNTGIRQLSQFVVAIIFFHASEYVLAVWIHGRSNVTVRSLLISRQYVIAMIFSILEYCLEITFFPWLKEYWWISNFGLAMVVIGEIIRKMSIITAGHAFTHLIRIHHEAHHRLVTHGIYRFVRHPGYCGFFIWSVGTQIMLLNPICTLAFAVVVWKFFAGRIPYEEFYLREFFGDEYDEYAHRVPSGVPFVR